MTLDNYYLHGIDTYGKNNPFDTELTLKKLEKIVSSGYISSRAKLGDNKSGGWNGIHYISLCDYSKRNNKPYNNDERFINYTSYEDYIKESLSLLIPKKNTKIVVPELVEPIEYERLGEMFILGNHPTKRFSDYPDEVQVKNKINLKRIEGITIPINRLIDEKCDYVYSNEQILKFLNEIKQILITHKLERPIYDLITQVELNNENDLNKVYTKLKDIQ